MRWWLKAGRNLWFLFSSRSQVVNFLKWKHYHLSENIAIFHSNYDLFTQYIFLNEKRCHLMTFSWRVGSERTKAREKWTTNSAPVLASTEFSLNWFIWGHFSKVSMSMVFIGHIYIYRMSENPVWIDKYVLMNFLNFDVTHLSRFFCE